MAERFLMPRLGQSMEEGEIVRWYKREGDPVRAGEPLLEVMTDKANMDVEAASDGVLLRILAGEGVTVPVNSLIAVIGAANERIADLLLAEPPDLPAASTHSNDAAAEVSHDPRPIQEPPGALRISPRARRLADEHAVALSSLTGIGTGPGGRVIERDVAMFVERQRSVREQLGAAPPPPVARATPLAARIADDAGVDLAALAAGLPGSRITAADVRRRVTDASHSAEPVGEPGIAQIIPFRGLRKLVAENVTRSRQTAPHVTLVAEVDMSAASQAVAALRPLVQKSHAVKLTVTDLIVLACAKALGDHPLCNAALVGDEIRVYADRNIGIAVATDDSLIVPVIRAADRKSIGDISAEAKALAERCRAGRQTQSDLAGGTFTVTNLGALGVDSFDPVIVPPQSCILGIGRMADRVVARDGAPAIRPMMNLCLSFDHRVLDGAPAARFLQQVKALLESPVTILV